MFIITENGIEDLEGNIRLPKEYLEKEVDEYLEDKYGLKADE